MINSGLLIDLETFESAGGYDERLRLDFSDFIFLKRLKRCIQDIIIINAECSHELSSSRKGTLSHALNRFEIYLKGTKVMRHKESAFVFVYTAFLRAIKLSIRYRSGKFIGSFLSNEL